VRSLITPRASLVTIGDQKERQNQLIVSKKIKTGKVQYRVNWFESNGG
jgi:hypothetical protein